MEILLETDGDKSVGAQSRAAEAAERLTTPEFGNVGQRQLVVQKGAIARLGLQYSCDVHS